LSSRTLIRGGCVLTLGAKTPNYAEADVLVEDGVITEVGQGLRARDAEQVDASNAIVMPGFVDAHRHAWKTLFRNLGELGATPGERLSSNLYGPHYRPDDVYAATLIGLLGAVEAGITTVVDWADIDPGAEHVDAALQAHRDAGVRSVFIHSMPGWEPSHGDVKAGLRRLAAQHAKSEEGSTTIAFGPGDPEPSDLDRVVGEWGLGRELGMRVHTHVGAHPSQRGAVAELARRGVLGEDVTLVHCSHLDETDLDAIASHHAAVALAPSSEMADGLAIPPIEQMIDRGIRPGLGIGSEHIAPGDIFAQMRAANSIQHAVHFDKKLAGKGGLPNLLSTRDVIRFATIDGARAVGLGFVTGSIEMGKRADIIVLRTDRPNIFPINDPIGAVVWGMDTSNLHWVFVDGRALMREGELTADVISARQTAIDSQQRVAATAGIGAGGFG
jgi:5-methylthioadenosine/S-adenosylhomocysteine deaminase